MHTEFRLCSTISFEVTIAESHKGYAFFARLGHRFGQNGADIGHRRKTLLLTSDTASENSQIATKTSFRQIRDAFKHHTLDDTKQQSTLTTIVPILDADTTRGPEGCVRLGCNRSSPTPRNCHFHFPQIYIFFKNSAHLLC